MTSLTVGHQNPIIELYAHSLYVIFSYVNGNLQNAFSDGPPIVLHTTKGRACRAHSYSKNYSQYVFTRTNDDIVQVVRHF